MPEVVQRETVPFVDPKFFYAHVFFSLIKPKYV